MIKFIILLLFIQAAAISNEISASSINYSHPDVLFVNRDDTITDNQAFYNGRIWNNNYLDIENDQFLFSRDFFKSSVSMGGKTYTNVLIRYDICNDEIITFSETGNLLQLNKELIDSFSFAHNSKIYRFIKLSDDLKSDDKGFFHVLYEGKTTLCVKYKKEIHYSTSEGHENRFVEVKRIYLFDNGNAYILNKKNDIFKVLKVEKSKIRELGSENKIELSVHDPGSFIPLLRSLEGSNK